MEAIAGGAHQILLHYGSQSSYPADLALFVFRDAFVAFTAHGCPREPLGRTLTRRFTPAQRTELLSHLPAAMAQSIRELLKATG